MQQREPEPLGLHRLHGGVRQQHLDDGTDAPADDPAPDDPPPTGGTCAAAWVSNTAYVSGNVVSYDGDNWTANQWNYDEAPGGASGAWNSDGAC